MHNDNLKSLITCVLEGLGEDKEVSQEEVVKFLQDAVSTIKKIDTEEFKLQAYEKNAHKTSYKDVAISSLNSYQSTNNTFVELTNLHADTLSQCKNETITPKFTRKITEIQSHMSKECTQASELISNLMQQIKTLEHSSNLDPLTKVLNRRALTSYLNKICANGHIRSELHVIMLDIDDFKLVNDTHGHVAGDKILIYLANILRKILRDTDKVFRYGGEEFVIVLNRISQQDCIRTTNRILETIRENNLIYMGKTINVTASVGVTMHLKNDTPDLLIERADKALYKAKENGKNQMYTEI